MILNLWGEKFFVFFVEKRIAEYFYANDEPPLSTIATTVLMNAIPTRLR